MASDVDTVWLRELTPGLCNGIIVVKVDLIITVETVSDMVPEEDHPKKVLCRYEIVVFDESLTHMVLVMESSSVMQLCGHKMAEERCYNISRFDVLSWSRST